MVYLVSLIVILLGTILHFTYELSNRNFFVGLFSAVNESTWEHLKLAVFPILFIGIFEYFILNGDVNNFIFSKLVAVVFSMVFISFLFYAYMFLFKKDYFVFDILIFVFGVILSEIISYKIMNLASLNYEIFSLILIGIIILLFNVFMISPPKIFLFQDPVSKTYGVY